MHIISNSIDQPTTAWINGAFELVFGWIILHWRVPADELGWSKTHPCLLRLIKMDRMPQKQIENVGVITRGTLIKHEICSGIFFSLSANRLIACPVALECRRFCALWCRLLLTNAFATPATSPLDSIEIYLYGRQWVWDGLARAHACSSTIWYCYSRMFHVSGFIFEKINSSLTLCMEIGSRRSSHTTLMLFEREHVHFISNYNMFHQAP